MPEPIRQQIDAGAATPEARTEVVHALNDLIASPNLFEAKELQPLGTAADFKEELRGLPEKAGTWKLLQRRLAQRVLLEKVLAGALRSRRRRSDPEYILAYRSHGEHFGEMGLITGEPRSATCVAYVHPQEGTGHRPRGVSSAWKDSELVELVKIPKKVFEELLATAPAIKDKVSREIAARKASDLDRQRQAAHQDAATPFTAPAFERLGLIQGQKLMLIDLDRCTRCDECVQACVNTHADGRSRLFLDGPKFGKYLVPTSCRSCLDPVCMIGCPVGSITRGDNRQMIIHDWCIGCGMCAKTCPYDSIQMHDVGAIAEASAGWLFLPESKAGPGWQQPNARTASWLTGRAPFEAGRELADRLKTAPTDAALCFRYEFNLKPEVHRAGPAFVLEVVSADEAAEVWINGVAVQTDKKAKRGRREFDLEAGKNPLKAGANVLAVKVKPPATGIGVVLDLRLDEVREAPGLPGMADIDVSQKMVTELAVVCDMCSEHWGQKPACVTACPHEAAMRVDARKEFPLH